jgi:putative transposase
MARKPRIQTPDLLRHIVSRGNGRMCIFLDDGDYRQFVHLLGLVCEEYAVECWSYCLMPNHYHAALRPERANISASIRCLNGEYAQWWNRKHGKVGHAFQGRFKDQIVQRERYLLALLRYIALNPVRAGLVTRPEEWEWSSYQGLAGLVPAPPFLGVSSALAIFDRSAPAESHEQFMKHVLGGDPALEDRIRSNERILGDGVFKKAVRGETDDDGAPELDTLRVRGEEPVGGVSPA